MAMEPVRPAVESERAPEGERARLLQAIAEGLADDDAGRTMDTQALKDSLEAELGPIAWR